MRADEIIISGSVHSVRIGEAIRAGISAALTGTKGVIAVRGMGLMIGIELDRPCGDLVQRALDAGLLINVTMDKVIRLLPALIINADEARQLVDILCRLVRDFLSQPVAAH